LLRASLLPQPVQGHVHAARVPAAQAAVVADAVAGVPTAPAVVHRSMTVAPKLVAARVVPAHNCTAVLRPTHRAKDGKGEKKTSLQHTNNRGWTETPAQHASLMRRVQPRGRSMLAREVVRAAREMGRRLGTHENKHLRGVCWLVRRLLCGARLWPLVGTCSTALAVSIVLVVPLLRAAVFIRCCGRRSDACH
jgi:hypothetical protein